MYNNDSNSLNAGAPDIRLSGNQQMASAPDPTAEMNDFSMQVFGKPLHQLTPPQLDALYELMNEQSKAPQQDSGIMAAAPTGTYTQNRKRQMAAGGGIMGSNNGSMLVAPTADGTRPGYGFLSDLKDKFVDDIIPNEIKENPVLTAALIGGGINQFGIPFLGEGDVGQNWLGNLLGQIPGVPDDLNLVLGDDIGFTGGITPGDFDFEDAKAAAARGVTSLEELSPFRKALATVLPGGDPGYVEGGLYNKILGGGGGDGITGMFSSALSPYLGAEGSRRVNPLYPLGIGAAVGKYVSGLPKDELPMDTTSIDPAAIAAAARGTDEEGAAAGLRFLPEQVTRAAEGGRIGADEGGLMNLGGMEKDYRNEGGFVALGGKEKADDVPARLSKNEFVFTADAVRNAGGGDIDQGAEIMENMMKNLEAGGEVSEDSQGLEGARGMFANAQKLQNRII